MAEPFPEKLEQGPGFKPQPWEELGRTVETLEIALEREVLGPRWTALLSNGRMVLTWLRVL